MQEKPSVVPLSRWVWIPSLTPFKLLYIICGYNREFESHFLEVSILVNKVEFTKRLWFWILFRRFVFLFPPSSCSLIKKKIKIKRVILQYKWRGLNPLSFKASPSLTPDFHETKGGLGWRTANVLFGVWIPGLQNPLQNTSCVRLKKIRFLWNVESGMWPVESILPSQQIRTSSVVTDSSTTLL